jgi:D-amino-acid oxidase
MPAPIAIIGAGVIGLTTGIRLLEAGHAVTAFARSDDIGTASRGAPALWIPYKAAPEDLILQWAKRSLEIYHDFTMADGVEKLPLREYYHEDHGDPLWSHIITDFQRLPSTELPSGYIKGYQTAIYCIDSSLFVDRLLTLFQQQGGQLIHADIKQLHAVDTHFPVIINCSGVWSHYLVPDEKSFPIRGQYLLVEKPEGLNHIIFASESDTGYTLIVPRQHDCYLGGTTLNHDWGTDIRPETTAHILRRTAEFEPSLAGMKIRHEGVCLRPGRESVRLERETLPDGRLVIHNYGHGGSGWTVAWGCAESVVSLLG